MTNWLPLHRLWLLCAALAGLTGVALAAAIAHALSDRLDPRSLAMLRDSVMLQGWHAAALLGMGQWSRARRLAAGPLATGRPGLVDLAAFAMALGLLLFCGAVDLLALAAIRLPSVAPTGGTLLMVAWLLVGIAAVRE
jgi:uncharacterized membrane protein YgdD (TMEM256/DUF423 family)